jgi:hypothetical protein
MVHACNGAVCIVCESILLMSSRDCAHHAVVGRLWRATLSCGRWPEGTSLLMPRLPLTRATSCALEFAASPASLCLPPMLPPVTRHAAASPALELFSFASPLPCCPQPLCRTCGCCTRMHRQTLRMTGGSIWPSRGACRPRLRRRRPTTGRPGVRLPSGLGTGALPWPLAGSLGAVVCGRRGVARAVLAGVIPAAASAPALQVGLLRAQALAGLRGAEAGPGAPLASLWLQAVRAAPRGSGKGSPARSMPSAMDPVAR